jgi:hypothetical protein
MNNKIYTGGKYADKLPKLSCIPQERALGRGRGLGSLIRS